MTFLSALRAGEYVGLESFPAPSLLRRTTYRSSELTTRCPYTGRSDFYQAEVTVTMGDSDSACLETKSLRLYLDELNGAEMSGERLAATLAGDIAKAIGGNHVEVTLHQNVRGGIGMTHVASAGWAPNPT